MGKNLFFYYSGPPSVKIVPRALSIYEYLGYGSPAFVCISFREISQFFAQIQVNQVSTYDNPDRYYKIAKKLAQLVKYFEMGYTSLNLGDVIGKV